MEIIKGEVYQVNRMLKDKTTVRTSVKILNVFAASCLCQDQGEGRKGQICTIPMANFVLDGTSIQTPNVEQPAEKKEPVVKETTESINESIKQLGNDEPSQPVVEGSSENGPAENTGEVSQTDTRGAVEISKPAENAEQPVAQPKEDSNNVSESPKPTLANKAAEVINTVEEMSAEAVKKLADTLPPKTNLKVEIIKRLKAGEKSSDIAASLGIKVAYVGQVKIDYLGDGPKEGTKKFEVLKLHKEGVPVEKIAADLQTSVTFVNSQVRLAQKREEAKAI